ncbi:MAG: cytochrome c3 family protein [Nitrospirae bacterium]|nr:cytochrome c3 family protein [Nitrospirota bacterium]
MNRSRSQKSIKAIQNFYFALLSICLMLIWLSAVNVGEVDAEAKLKANIPDLCYDCHKELKKDLSAKYVHFLFKDGKCITCHNSHVSTIKGLMNDDINSICLSCHENLRDLIRKGIVHPALKESSCTGCHNAHSSEYNYILIGEEKTLCRNCHEKLKEQFEKPHACVPFKEGKCSECHNSHASTEEGLLLSSSNKLCQKCHPPRCRAGEVSISTMVKDSDCTSCHTGHSSRTKGLPGPYGHTDFLIRNCEKCHNPITANAKITTRLEGQALCFSCHKKEDSKYKYIDNDVHVKNVKNPCNICHDYHGSRKKNLTKNEKKICNGCHESTEKRTASMEKALKTVRCAPVRDRKCFECHIPMHSDRPFNYRDAEDLMCARCHESQHKITHPIGATVIDPRNGKPVTCTSCHSMHSAMAEFLLTADRNRALCVQCHKM